MESHNGVIAGDDAPPGNPGDAADYWICAFAGMTAQNARTMPLPLHRDPPY